MLPFLKKRESQVSGLIMKMREPDVKPDENQEDDSSAAIEACAQELIRSIHNKDIKAVAQALKDAFEVLESLPEDEDESSEPSPRTYDAQNQQAAKEQD